VFKAINDIIAANATYNRMIKLTAHEEDARGSRWLIAEASHVECVWASGG
jgi:hypothetical protein